MELIFVRQYVEQEINSGDSYYCSQIQIYIHKTSSSSRCLFKLRKFCPGHLNSSTFAVEDLSVIRCLILDRVGIRTGSKNCLEVFDASHNLNSVASVNSVESKMC